MDKDIEFAPLPEIGKKYYFFYDGKIAPGRLYAAEVLEIHPADEEIIVHIPRYENDEKVHDPYNIQDLHKDIAEGCKWLYADETDYYIKCKIPVFDDEYPMWFVRGKNGEWQAIDVYDWMQSGILDVTGKIYRYAKEDYDKRHYPGYYDEIIKNYKIKE